MDRRVSFNEALYTLLNAHNGLPEPRYAGDEIRLPVVQDVQKLITQYQLGHDVLANVTADRRIVLFADRGVRWPGTGQAPLEWFFKGVE